MKHKTILAAAIYLVAAAAYAQGVWRPVPPSSLTDNRVTSVYVAPVPDLSFYAPVESVGRGVRAWSTYFLGQTKYWSAPGLSGIAIISPEGVVNSGFGTGMGIPLGNASVITTTTVITRNCGDTGFGTGQMIATPLFSDEAKRNGGPPYDWAVTYVGPDSITNTGCL